MNKDGFLFVTCVNDDVMYERCLAQLQRLVIPTGFEVSYLRVTDVESMTAGYNQALHHPQKYKVYIHQDTFIIYPYALLYLLQLFTAHPKLGMVGVIGCKELPQSGIWWESDQMVGMAIDRPGPYRLLSYPGDKGYTPIAAIDGLFMATQVDLPWREDIFQGFHFYDISQSYEMARNGYQVGVIEQKEPWCIHESGDRFDQVGYSRDLSIFLNYYIHGDK
ncbi:glycosyltransferase family protein [Rossellomorea yichunensis]|uniref:glycosyltransferase family protein n=1 Tax=Rossellomorea yichunensis TaxID=3077331 RepID=UPI0028DDEA81|nr:glycosyltransferase family protein [Rossellomorea sp. YC4-1]MDT9027888.1 glycosyltransferase family protein [Rossellomorea sp. YC4-1]